MAKRIVVAATTGDHSVSSWDNSVELSLRKDGSVSAFGYCLLANENGELHRTRVFSRTGLRDGIKVAEAIEEAVRESGCDGVWDGADEEAIKEVEEYCPGVAVGLREAWAEYLDEDATEPCSD